jgi:hypothetical protein
MFTTVREALRASASFRAIRARLAAGSPLTRVGGAGASFLSFLAADLAEGEERRSPLLPRPEGRLFAEEIEGLIGEEKVFLYPPGSCSLTRSTRRPSVTALRQRPSARSRGAKGA